MKPRCASALLSLLLLWLAAATTTAADALDRPLAAYRWGQTVGAGATGTPSGAHLQIIDGPPYLGGKILKINNPGDGPLQVNVLTIPRPPISGNVYRIEGQVRYEDVSGDGYLEMWNVFPGGGRYFSRTLGASPGDPMARLTGNSDWRPFLLPFDATGAHAPPERLEINVVLPGRGTVYLSSLQLAQLAISPPAAAPKSGWTTHGGLTGLGACLTAMMVALCFLAQRQQHRAFVIAGAWTLTALTVCLLLVAVGQAWKLGLPPVEWTVRLIAGVFLSGMFAACAWSFQRRYRRAEWRRMTAMDA